MSSFKTLFVTLPNQGLKNQMMRFVHAGYEAIKPDTIASIEDKALQTLNNEEYFKAIEIKRKPESQAVLKSLSYADHIKRMLSFFTVDPPVPMRANLKTKIGQWFLFCCRQINTYDLLATSFTVSHR